jgi:hypothetical protein
MDGGTSMFVDVLTLRSGRNVAEAQAYFDRIGPIAARHGLHRVSAIRVDRKTRGLDELSPQIVQLWRVEGDNAFTGLGGDPDYQAIIPARDELFDMPSLQGWLGTVL